jgi:hypothetical protein
MWKQFQKGFLWASELPTLVIVNFWSFYIAFKKCEWLPDFKNSVLMDKSVKSIAVEGILVKDDLSLSDF